MHNKILFLLFFISLSVKNNAQCLSAHSQDKIMLMGDSWAFFMMTYSAHNNALEKYGFSDLNLYSNANLSINGAETTTFLASAKKQEVISELSNNPFIKYVHISLGGNDLLGTWNVAMDSVQSNTLIQTVIKRIDSIVMYLKQTRPDLKIYISSYDYPNFGETATNPLHPFYDTWQSMGFPDFYEINTALSWYAAKLQQYADTTQNVATVDCRGLMQYYYGQTTPLTVSPGGTYPPYTAPVPGGFINYPSPKDAMGASGFDSFHLSSDGYQKFVDYQFENYFFNALLNDAQYVFYCDSVGSGSISTNAIQYDFYCGTDTLTTFTTQLAFNTSAISVADNIENVHLFINADSSFVNLFSQNNFSVWIKSGYFGNANIELTDISDTLGVVEFINPCHYGTFTEKGNWLRISFDSTVSNYINRSGVTQLQIQFNNLPAGNIMKFANATSLHRPILSINSALISSVNNHLATTESNILIYPNPTFDNINIQGIDAKNPFFIEVYNVSGQIVSVMLNATKINVADLPKGIYLLKVTSNEGVAVKTFVKN